MDRPIALVEVRAHTEPRGTTRHELEGPEWLLPRLRALGGTWFRTAIGVGPELADGLGFPVTPSGRASARGSFTLTEVLVARVLEESVPACNLLQRRV